MQTLTQPPQPQQHSPPSSSSPPRPGIKIQQHHPVHLTRHRSAEKNLYRSSDASASSPEKKKKKTKTMKVKVSKAESLNPASIKNAASRQKSKQKHELEGAPTSYNGSGLPNDSHKLLDNTVSAPPPINHAMDDSYHTAEQNMFPNYPVHYDPNDQNLNFDEKDVSETSGLQPPVQPVQVPQTEYGIEYGSPPNSPSKPQPSKFRFQNAPKELCVQCHKSVYAAEKTFGPASLIYHKLCLRCNSCNNVLHSGLWVDHDKQPFCKACYAKYFGPRGIGFGTLSFTQ